jgi:hypothetical protein
MRKARLDEIATIEDLAHGAAGDRQPDRAAISWRERAGKTRILEADRVSSVRRARYCRFSVIHRNLNEAFK